MQHTTNVDNIPKISRNLWFFAIFSLLSSSQSSSLIFFCSHLNVSLFKIRQIFFCRDCSFFAVAGHWNSSKRVSWMVLIRQKPSMFLVYISHWKEAYTEWVSACVCVYVRWNKSTEQEKGSKVFYASFYVYLYTNSLAHLISKHSFLVSIDDYY